MWVSLSIWLEPIGKSNSKWYHKGKTEDGGKSDNNGILIYTNIRTYDSTSEISKRPNGFFGSNGRRTYTIKKLIAGDKYKLQDSGKVP